MSPRQTLLGWGTVLLAGLLLFVSLTFDTGSINAMADGENAEGDSPPNRSLDPHEFLPADPILYVNWEGQAANKEAFQKTAAYEALYESGLIASVKKIATQSLASLPSKNQLPPEIVDLAQDVFQTVMANGFSLSVSTLGDGKPLPWGALVLHDAADLEPRIAKLLKNSVPPRAQINFDSVDVQGRKVTVVRTPAIPVGEISWWTEGGHLVVAFGVNATQQTINVLEGEVENITTSRLFEPPAKLDFEQNCFVWLDMEQLLDVLGKIEVPAAGRGEPPVPISKLVSAFGIDDIRAIVMRSGMSGKAIRRLTRIEFVEEADGWGMLADVPAFTLDDLPPLPPKNLALFARAFDADKVYAFLRQARASFGKLAPAPDNRKLDKALERLDSKIDIDLKTDLIEPLGNLAVGYNDLGQSASFWGITLLIAVDDAPKLRSSLDSLGQSLADEFSDKELSIVRSEKLGQEIVTFQIAGGMGNPSYAVTDEWLVISILPQNIETFLLRTQGELPSWQPDATVSEALAEMPHEMTGLTIVHPAPSLKALYGMVPILVSVMRGAIVQENPDAELTWTVGDLPPTALVTRPLFPNVTVATVEGNSLIYRSRASLPVPNIGVGTTAVLVALLLPAVQSAREAARRAQSQNNLKQIALALHNYHGTFRHFPAGTVEKSAKKVTDRLSWQASILPFVERGNLYQRLDMNAAWNSEENRPLVDTRIPVYINPSAPLDAASDEAAPTTYVGIAGVGEDGPTLPADHPRAGIFAYNRTTRISDIRDGTSYTMMTSEAAHDLGPWAQGGESTIRALTKKPYVNGPDGLGGYHSGGMQVGLADGSVRFISENIDPSVMEALATISGGEVIQPGDF